MKNWIIRHSTGFLYYTDALTSSVILLDPPNVRRAFDQIINIYSISDQNRASELLWQKELTNGVNQMWILRKRSIFLQSRSFSSCNIINTFEFSTLYTSNHYSKLKDVVKLHCQITFLVQCCNVRCYCRVKTMFSSSLLPFVL